MKKFPMLLLFVLYSISLAANSGPENLEDIPLCFNSSDVQLPSDLEDQTGLADELFTTVNTKLLAYRINYDECDDLAINELYLQINSLTDTDGTTAYTISIDVYNTEMVKGIASLYNIARLGITPLRSDLSDDINNATSALIDHFAADYALANP